MVDTIDVTQASDFIPEIWAQTALPILRSNIVLTPRVYSDSDVSPFGVGDILNIPYPGTLSPTAKSAGTAYALAQPSGEDTVAVTLNKQYATSFIIEDVVRAQANQDLMRVYSTAAAIGLAERIELDGFAVAEAASNSIGAYGTDLDFADILSAWKTLTDNKAPSGDRFMAVSTKDLVALVGDSDIQAWAAYSRGNAIVGDPTNLGAIGGFQEVLASQLVTAAAATPVQTKNIAWRRDGLIAAFRGLPEPPAGSGAVGANVRDPESGVVMRTVMAYDSTYGGVRVTFEVLYGWKILEEAKVLLVKS
ncbi:MAG TPA: hypothetical protein VMX12_03085 [Acidimicrobiia bacterium]|nr:hypothetical protein [Acidimicrobiia bacterium]